VDVAGGGSSGGFLAGGEEEVKRRNRISKRTKSRTLLSEIG
jgi:hypothetical protein